MLTLGQARQIVIKIETCRLYDSKEILEYLQTSGITESKDMLKIIDAMLRSELYFAPFIIENFANYAQKNKQFLGLTIKLSRIDRLEFAVFKFTHLYESNPTTANYLYGELKEYDEYRIALTVGHLLGGMGCIEPQKLWGIIDANKKPTINEQISYIRAIEIASQNNQIPKKFMDLLFSYADSDHKHLKSHVVEALVIYFNDVKRVQTFLIRYAKQSCENKNLVLQNVTTIIKENKEFSLKILKTCFDAIVDGDLADKIAMSLGDIAPTHPIEALTMLKKFCKRQEIHLTRYLKWVASEAGKGDIEKIEKFLLDWIRVEKNTSLFEIRLPCIIVEIYATKDRELLRLLEKINFRSKTRAYLLAKIIQASLFQGSRTIERSDLFLRFCNEILRKIANRRNLEIDDDNDLKAIGPIIHILVLADTVVSGKKKVPLSEIKKNLKSFPNAVSFFRKSKLENLITTQPLHPLAQILSYITISEDRIKRMSKQIDKQDDLHRKEMMRCVIVNWRYPKSLFCDMDASFKMIEEHERGRSSIRRGMLDKNSFFQTLIELNVYARFKKIYCTVLQPAINGNNKLDVEVDIDGTRCLFEIYSPKADFKLKHVITLLYNKKNKAKSGILNKLESQLKSAEGLGTPIVLIIDNSNDASVTEIEIGNLLFGTYQWAVITSKKTYEIVDEYATRKKDSISTMSQYGKVISAVILLKLDMDATDMKIKLYGKTFLNPCAAIPLSEKMVRKIEHALFEQAVI